MKYYMIILLILTLQISILNEDVFCSPKVVMVKKDYNLVLTDNGSSWIKHWNEKNINHTLNQQKIKLYRGNEYVLFSDDAGCSWKKSNVLSIENVENLFPILNIYPNPTTTILNIGDNKNLKRYLITDLLGRVIIGCNITENNHQSEITIDVSDFKNGIYNILLEYYDKKMTNHIFIKQ